MSKKEKGGAAFPQSGFDRWAPEGGMSLRDYFAAKAMPMINQSLSWEDVAKFAYQMADAMLAERDK